MTSNLPPGVTDSMIPGNRSEDLEWESFHMAIDADCVDYALSPDEARKIWNLGVANGHVIGRSIKSIQR